MKTIKVKVFPNARKQQIIKKTENSFEISIKEKPEKGLANECLIKIIANYFNVSCKKIRLIKGFKQRNKILQIK